MAIPLPAVLLRIECNHIPSSVCAPKGALAAVRYLAAAEKCMCLRKNTPAPKTPPAAHASNGAFWLRFLAKNDIKATAMRHRFGQMRRRITGIAKTPYESISYMSHICARSGAWWRMSVSSEIRAGAGKIGGNSRNSVLGAPLPAHLTGACLLCAGIFSSTIRFSPRPNVASFLQL